MTEIYRQYLKEFKAPISTEKTRRRQYRIWLPDRTKAEFINGKVVIHPPARRCEMKAAANLKMLIGLYVDINDLGETAFDKALVAFPRHDFLPDFCFWEKGKSVAFHPDTSIHPIPDFVVEVLSKFSEENDRTIKFNDYEKQGVGEYWIVDADKQIIEQYIQSPEKNGFLLIGEFGLSAEIESLVVKNIKIPVNAIFIKKANLDALKKML